jgi:hypothetical protein
MIKGSSVIFFFLSSHNHNHVHAMPPKTLKHRPTAVTRDCPHCGEQFNARGFGRHEPSCRRKRELTTSFDVGTDADRPNNDGIFFIHPHHRELNFSSTDDEMGATEYPPDAIDDDAGRPTDGDINGECERVPGTWPQGSLFDYKKNQM